MGGGGGKKKKEKMLAVSVHFSLRSVDSDRPTDR